MPNAVDRLVGFSVWYSLDVVDIHYYTGYEIMVNENPIHLWNPGLKTWGFMTSGEGNKRCEEQKMAFVLLCLYALNNWDREVNIVLISSVFAFLACSVAS